MTATTLPQTSGEDVKVTVRCSETLWRTLKYFCAENKTSLQAVFTEAVQAHIEQQPLSPSVKYFHTAQKE